jgi:RNA polymerase sigma factor (sigma-70 family)
MGRPRFAPTRWSLVLRSRSADDREARAAFGELCSAYYTPLVEWLGGRGHERDDAEDLVQGLYVRMLSDPGGPVRAAPGQGRFRSYLLAALRNHASDTGRAGRAQRRGGDVEHVPWDDEVAARDERPDAAFDRAWAREVLRRAIERIERAPGPDRQAFDALLDAVLVPERTAASRDELAKRLGCSVAALRVRIHRLRRQLAAAVRAEIADTVPAEEGEDGVQEELRDLFRAFTTAASGDGEIFR